MSCLVWELSSSRCKVAQSGRTRPTNMRLFTALLVLGLLCALQLLPEAEGMALQVPYGTNYDTVEFERHNRHAEPTGPPRRPSMFKSAKELQQYVAALRDYYSLVGRQRFGRSTDRQAQGDNHYQDRELLGSFREPGESPGEPH